MPGFDKLQVERICRAIATWADRDPKIYAVALVGSWARNEAHPDSDIDLMVLTSDPERFFHDNSWFDSIPWQELNLQLVNHYDRVYGVVKSRHFCFQDRQRIEFGFGYRSWANIDPIDLGTLGVVSSGMRIISDRHQLLENLVKAIA